MANYYANLDLSGTGGDGSSGNPWHAATFFVQCQTLTGVNTIYVRGSAELDDFYMVSDLTLLPWISAPYRIRVPGNNSSVELSPRCSITQMILEIELGESLILDTPVTFNSCYINITDSQGNALFNAGCVLNGCTIITPKIYGPAGGSPCSIVDSVLSSSTLTRFDLVNSNNCVYTAGSIPGSGTHTYSQVGWTPPTWPVWDAAQSAFLSTTLSVGINTPPEPGNSPYSGYSTGLWGTARSGIGAMDFPSVALSITTQPLSQTIALGGTLNLSVAATGGSGPYTYQWKKDSSNIQDATYSSYSKSNFAETNAGLYKASVNDDSTTVLSNDATVKYSLTIDTQPLSQTITLGGTLNLSVTASGGTSPYTYQWKKGVGNITDATFSSYTKTNFVESDATTYKVLVNDSTGSSLLSNGAVINYPLTIDTQPDSTTVPLGATLSLNVGVSGGSGSYSYQWKKDNSNVQDATFSTYSKSNFAKTDAGLYKVSANDGTTTVLSNDSTVRYALTIDTQPQSQTVNLGDTFSLSVVASGGTAPYTYQWKKGVSNITDATFSSYTKTNFIESDATTYKVQVTDALSSSLLSNGAVIKYPVNIDSLSDSTTVPLNSSVTISVSVSGGSGSYTYQWQKNTGDISGAVSSSYTINPFHEINAGIYRVFVNDGIETIISNDVVLSYPLAIDTQPQSQALAIGAPLTLSVGVSGGSGVYTYQWKKNTVNISGATSGTYNISHSAASDAGSYTVVVNDGLTSQTSSAAIITSNFTIIAQPVSQGTYFGGTIPLSVVLAGGSGSYTYQWKKDGSNVLSATDSTYSITNFSSAKFGSYTVLTGDGTSTILSGTAFISGTTTIVDIATDTTQISQNGHLYGTSFVWELDPKTLVPIRVTTKHNF